MQKPRQSRVKCRWCWKSYAPMHTMASGEKRDGWTALRTHVMSEHADLMEDGLFESMFHETRESFEERYRRLYLPEWPSQ